MTFPLHVTVDRLGEGASRILQHVIRSAVPSVAPALALCVWQAGEVRYDVHAGWVDPRRGAHQVHGDAFFDLASLTKLFTASAFLALVSDGRAGLDQAVVEVVPRFGASGARRVDGGQEPLSRRPLPVPAERAGWRIDPREVTFRQLLTHTSGLAPWRSVFGETGPAPPPPTETDRSSRHERWEAGLQAVFRYPFVDRPGAEVHYSDLGYMTLGAAVSRLAEAPLDAAIASLVTHPLALGCGFRPLATGLPLTRIVPTSIDEDWRRRRCHGEVEDENAAGLGGVAGHAGLFGTVRDVAWFGQAWLTRDPRLRIDGDLVMEAVGDQSPGKAEARGFGWQVQPADHLSPLGPRAFGHTGFTGTSLAVDPDQELVVALLTNRVFAARTHEGIDDLRLRVHAALGQAYS